MYVFTHIGTAACCTTVLDSVSVCTRLHVHGDRGRGEEEGGRTRGSGVGKGDTDKVSLARSYYETKARKE